MASADAITGDIDDMAGGWVVDARDSAVPAAEDVDCRVVAMVFVDPEADAGVDAGAVLRVISSVTAVAVDDPGKPGVPGSVVDVRDWLVVIEASAEVRADETDD